MRLLVLNGPNLNLLGRRRPEVYGSTTLAQLEEMTTAWAEEIGFVSVDTFQSNHEGALIDRIHQTDADGIVFNPGAYTHTSYALHDALESVAIPTVEVHISNVEEREPWRRISVVRPACLHTVYGRGIDGYRWAIRHLAAELGHPSTRIPYGDGPSRFLDLRFPAGEGPHPVVFLVHGGFWRHFWTHDLMSTLALDLVGRGLAVANVEYRRCGAGGSGATFPADVAAAVDLVADLPEIDPGRMGMAGHSAGGHLTLLEATRGRLQVAVGMGAVTDLVAGVAADLGSGAVLAYLDGVEPARLSPCHGPRPEGEVLLVHGTSDDRVPVSQAETYASTFPETRLELIEGADHFGFLDPADPLWTPVADALETL